MERAKVGYTGISQFYDTHNISNYLGQMEELTYPDGEVVSYSYDTVGQVIGITGYHYGDIQVYLFIIL